MISVRSVREKIQVKKEERTKMLFDKYQFCKNEDGRQEAKKPAVPITPS
jgi:hypothetical protein